MTGKPSHSTASRTTFGSVALLAAFVIVFLQFIGNGYDRWPDLLAILLAILGVGLRIEAALADRAS